MYISNFKTCENLACQAGARMSRLKILSQQFLKVLIEKILFVVREIDKNGTDEEKRYLNSQEKLVFIIFVTHPY